MLTLFELLIGVVVIVGVARYIIKGYSATGVLFVGGGILEQQTIFDGGYYPSDVRCGVDEFGIHVQL